jgi:L-rhamnose-H+ transport protein
MGYWRIDVWTGRSLLGMSLGNSVILGFCSAFGSLIQLFITIMYPPGKEKQTFDFMLHNSGGQLVCWACLFA